jgi:ACS family tartrate transporter-like MFS transporter
MNDREGDDEVVARSAIAKASLRVLPLIVLAYLVAFVDRVNISFAAAQMNADLNFSATIYGLGGGLFFLGYALFEVPSNVLLVRYGARRWIARIMITWGLLAAGMLFVKLPIQFYVMRFLLGVAEAGFFPGVIFYLSSWFPLAYRGRAISRFYAAAPLASVAMGAVSAWLLDLDGYANLRGWQWLFLVQGLPAVVIGFVFLRFIPDTPAGAPWLTPSEKHWIQFELWRDAARIGEPAKHDVFAVLRIPLVWQLGAIGLLTIGANLAFILSAPTILAAATGFDPRHVGYIVSTGGLLGALSILVAGWYSDRRGERFTSAIAGNVFLASSFVMLLLFHSPVMVVFAYLVFAAGCFATQMLEATIWPDVLHLRVLAVAAAAINSIANLGGFIAPYLWGAAKDATGDYRAGLAALPMVYLTAAVLIFGLRRKIRATQRSPTDDSIRVVNDPRERGLV